MSGGKHGRGVEPAWQMLDMFASLGAHTFDVTRTDIDGHKRAFGRGMHLETIRSRILDWMEAASQCQHNLIVRPQGARTELTQLDDLSGVMLERIRAAAFLILATSPGNHQAWVAIVDGGADFARRLRHAMGADPSASGATRVAGSINFKRKYAPDFPIVQLLDAVPQRTVTRAELEALGLALAPEPNPPIRPARVSV